MPTRSLPTRSLPTRRFRTTALPALPALLLFAGVAAGSVYGFLDQGAVRYFRGDDTKMMSGNIDSVLASPADNQPHDWRNPQTGSHGSAVAQRSFEHNGMRCRRVRIENHASGVDGTTTADMCDVDGTWKVLRLPE